MIIEAPVPFRRPRRGKTTAAPPASGPLAQARVVAVIAMGGQLAWWVFSVPFSLGADDPQLILDTDAGPQLPTDYAVVSDHVLSVVYGDGDIEAGLTWHLNTAAGLVFAGGVPVPLPQSGTTVQ